jgi:glucose-6-phosphate 1-epimerase
MPYFELLHPSGAQLDVYLHGAHVTCWRDAGGRQNLFMSKKSLFKPAFPIRGGIPIVFPQFGDGPLPKHGFARINEWKLLGGPCEKDDCVEVRLGLIENSRTMELWPHKFRLELGFRLKAMELKICFSVTNSGMKEFRFNNGLHTYFSVADISRAAVTSLAGHKFIDFIGTGREEIEKRDRIIFDRETDRVYPFAPDKVVLEDTGNHRRMVIKKQAMNDIVIWNPWVEKAKRMEDFGNTEYKTMVCVETGNLHGTIRIAPGDIHKSVTTFEV